MQISNILEEAENIFKSTVHFQNMILGTFERWKF
jgi:hypothetical protein